MLRYLLDEHISPVVARDLVAKHPEIYAASVHNWRSSTLRGADDEAVLRAAHEDGLTLVTYDHRTVFRLLRDWADKGVVHSGVIFIKRRTVPQNDFGGLIRALAAFWQDNQHHDWTNHVAHLTRPKSG